MASPDLAPGRDSVEAGQLGQTPNRPALLHWNKPPKIEQPTGLRGAVGKVLRGAGKFVGIGRP